MSKTTGTSSFSFIVCRFINTHFFEPRVLMLFQFCVILELLFYMCFTLWFAETVVAYLNAIFNLFLIVLSVCFLLVLLGRLHFCLRLLWHTLDLPQKIQLNFHKHGNKLNSLTSLVIFG